MINEDEQAELLELLELRALSPFELRRRRFGESAQRVNPLRLLTKVEAICEALGAGESQDKLDTLVACMTRDEMIVSLWGRLPEEAFEPDMWEKTRDEGSAATYLSAAQAPAPRDESSAQHIPQAPAPAPPEKQGERERQEPSQDEQPGLPRAHDVEGLAGPSGAHDDWVSRLGSPGSTRPSGRRSGPHGWMG